MSNSFCQNKEIVKLNRDKQKLINDIGVAMERIKRLEGSLFGRQVFNIDATEDKVIQGILSQNLRQDAYCKN